MNTQDYAAELLAQIEAIPVIDSHEHLAPKAERVTRGDDTEEEALQIAQFLLHDSPVEAFKLSL